MKTFIFSILFFVASIAHAIEDFADLYESNYPSVVTVYTESLQISKGQPRSGRGIGSGVLIENNQILTAAHVVDDAKRIVVQFTDGTRIRADIVSSVQASDVALLQLRKSPPNPVVATLADSDEARIGSRVFIIGAPFGISQTLSVGHLSGRMNRGLMAAGTPIEFLQTDTAINTGNSGGPMFNDAGEVIGIVSFILSKSGGFDGIGFATAINTTKKALLNSSGVLAGFEGVILNEKIAKALNYPQPGLLVQRVVANSVAEMAGLQSGSVRAEVEGQAMLLGGDLILEINGLICATPHDFDLVRESTIKLQENETYAIKVYRNGEIVQLIAGQPADGLQTVGNTIHKH